MKFYEKIIGINKDALGSPELKITFSKEGFEFDNNLYLANQKILSLNGLDEEAIRFRYSQTSIEDLDQYTLRFRGNGKHLDFDFDAGTISSPSWNLGSVTYPFNKGYFSNLLSPGNLKIEALSNNHLILKAGSAEMTFDQDTVGLLGHLTVNGDIIANTLSGTINPKYSTLNTFGDVYEAFLSPNTLSIVSVRPTSGQFLEGLFYSRIMGVRSTNTHDSVVIYYTSDSGEIRSDSGDLDDNTPYTWTRYYL